MQYKARMLRARKRRKAKRQAIRNRAEKAKARVVVVTPKAKAKAKAKAGTKAKAKVEAKAYTSKVPQCSAATKSGARCSRQAEVKVGNVWLCAQHAGAKAVLRLFEGEQPTE